jgi:16S rRNA (adenine1518-N6/adenine1519-N6)-dimethyltransferase
MSIQKKSLGQHWLRDPQTLEAIAEAAEIKKSDTILEIGPGLGTLTHYLTSQARHVVALELDKDLAKALDKQNVKNLKVINADILRFNLGELPAGYKVVANIPYYLTSNLLRVLSEAPNPPSSMVLLVQKEVAERICAKPGQMSILAVSVQLHYSAELGVKVPAELFEPPPKVDSQLIILKKHPKPIFTQLDTKLFFRVVKAGFSAKRKKLSGSLSGGLDIDKETALGLLSKAKISGDLRAQNLNLKDWYRLYSAYLERMHKML